MIRSTTVEVIEDTIKGFKITFSITDGGHLLDVAYSIEISKTGKIQDFLESMMMCKNNIENVIKLVQARDRARDRD